MPLTYRIEQFEGPLDLLLRLIEKEELDITEISLSKVADQFVAHVNSAKGKILPEELADFLVVAAKLVYLKSKILLPNLEDEEMEEGPDLATQLKLYQQFVRVSGILNTKWNQGAMCYARERRPVKRLEIAFQPPQGITTSVLNDVMKRLIQRLQPVTKLPETAVKRVITIQEKISDLAKRLRSKAKLTFTHFIGKAKDKNEAVVSFLALLELVKQRVVKVDQKDIFHEIDIAAHDLDRLADLKIEFI